MPQDATRIELKAVVGTTGFIDDPINYHSALGGAVRLRLSDRVSVEPEVLYLRESSLHDDFSFQTAIVWDLSHETSIQPYLMAAGGLLHSRYEFPGAWDEHFSSNEFTGAGGVGVRIRLRDRLWLSPEFRLGWEPLVRATLSVGYTFR